MRRPPADDDQIWRRAMHDVAPLRARSSVSQKPRETLPGSPQEPARPARASQPLSQPPAEPLPPLDRFAGVDRATAERLKRGRRAVEARLDLHGMTQAEAHRALSGFVGRSRDAGRRCVLVITGHGRSTGGILKAAVPRWLGDPELRHHVLAIAPAQPKDGGSGALYVLLRRQP